MATELTHAAWVNSRCVS